MATRQNSTNGKPKSPRIQVVLPEHLCEQLADLGFVSAVRNKLCFLSLSSEMIL